jgi:hypothetical protein
MRHIRVAEFADRHVSLMKHLATLSLSKVYALTRVEPDLAKSLAQDPKVQQLSDVAFAQHLQPFLGFRKRRVTTPNVFRSIMAGLARAERGIQRWQRTHRGIAAEYQAKVLGRLNAMRETVSHLKQAGTVA